MVTTNSLVSPSGAWQVLIERNVLKSLNVDLIKMSLHFLIPRTYRKGIIPLFH